MIAKEHIILVGGGGHCKSCIDVIEQGNKYKIKGIIDIPEKLGQEILGYKIIGNDDDIPDYVKQGYNFLITVGHLGDPNLRIKLFNIIKDNKGSLPVIISPLANVSKYSIIEEGTIVMHKALVNADSRIDKNCIINSMALIEHDCVVNNNVHLSTGAIINGNCQIGKNCLIGSQSVTRQSVNICNNTIIGAGAVITKDITEAGIYVGSPVRKIN